MAQQSIVNVDSRVGQSVVDSTTDVDVSKTASSTTSGGNTEENLTRTNTRDPGSVKATEEGTESGGLAMSESNKTIDESRTQTPGIGGELVDSDVDIGSGAGSPTKGAGVEGATKPTLRTSVKKPQSFKAVSINKHFLEKTSTTGASNTPSKVIFGSERISSLSPQITPSSPATLSFAKPRLVAKSTSGVRDSSPGGLGTSSSGAAKNAIEAQRAVWNKNQPPPANPTKEMTDEELKKNFGIHLASRLQSEDAGKETTWADEDDDDDWVPETIQWNDGTKVDLQVESTPTTHTATDPIAAPIAAPIATPPAAPPAAPIAAPVPIAVPTAGPTAAPPAKHSEKESKQSEPKTLVFTKDPNKGVDKSDKGIKDAPPPRTSPWATLPPANVVPLSNPRNESRAGESVGPQHNNLSREVHTDDFNRSWRDRPMNNQLYNSQTGQLEPVQDQRRGLRGSKPELQPGKTQVLQRPPSQLSGPAEPSSAFQQSRTGSYRQDEYRRRRTSSNVSGGSGSIDRRLSFNKGIHGLEHPFNPEDHTYSSQYVPSASLPQSDSQSPQALNGPLTSQNAITAVDASNETASTPSEDPIAMQARIMREARELARKRRLEEEAKEEAAKKERLRVKLEALEKEAAEKAAKAAAEAEKTTVLTNSINDVVTGLAPSSATQNSIDTEKLSLNRQSVYTPEQPHNNNNNTSSNINDNHLFNSQQPPHSLPSQTTETHYKASSVSQPSHTQPQSLASIPYRPGSFGNRSPVKKFSTIHPSSQPAPSLSPTNTYTMPIRDSRYDPQDPSGDRFANQNRFPYTEGNRWSTSRASPYGSIGDRARPVPNTDTRNVPLPNQQTSPDDDTNKVANTIPEPPVPNNKEGINVAPNIPVQTENNTNTGPFPPRAPAQQSVPRIVRGIPAVPNPTAAATDRARFNPWASYPEQIQRQEREELRLAREKMKDNVLPVEYEYVEEWRPRDPTDIEHSTTEMNNIKDEHKVAQHGKYIQTDSGPSHQISNQLQHTDVLSSGVVISKPPSTPPPADFCPVTALDLSSDDDVQNGDYSRRQAKKFVPHVRLPNQNMKSGESRPASSLDNYQKFEASKSDVTRYDRVLGNIMKTIEVSKGQHNASPTTTAPAKFSETKPVFTEDRETQQQTPTTVSLPPRIEEISVSIEPQDMCTNDEEEFLQHLYVQEFGSQPTVRIPVVYGTYIPQRTPSIAKSKKTTRPKGFAESVPLFEVVTEDDLLTDQGYPYIPIRLGPDAETKRVVIHKGWPKPLRREPRKPTNYNNNSNNRKSGGNNSFFKKESKSFLNQQRPRMQSSGTPKPPHIQAWERQQQHPVVQ